MSGGKKRSGRGCNKEDGAEREEMKGDGRGEDGGGEGRMGV